MFMIIDGHGMHGRVDQHVARLRRLADHLEKLQQGWRPTSADLADAPFLDEVRLAPRNDVCLSGVCTNHPTLAGPRICTSSVWVFAPQLGWARTYSRWCRLGRPARFRQEH